LFRKQPEYDGGKTQKKPGQQQRQQGIPRVFGIQKLMKIAKSKGASKITFLTQVKESVNTRAV
jgi:hypothetical protein